MFTTDLGILYNRNSFKTSLYIYIFQDEKCRLMRNLSLSMLLANKLKTYKFENCQMFAVNILEFSLNKERKSKNLSIQAFKC